MERSADSERSVRWRKLSSEVVAPFQLYTSNETGEIDPELLVKFLQRPPSLRTFSDLSRRLKTVSDQWMVDFLEYDGLRMLFEVLERISGRQLVKFTDAMLQLNCVGCIKAVMNSETGLNFMTTSDRLTRQLVTGKLQLCSVSVWFAHNSVVCKG